MNDDRSPDPAAPLTNGSARERWYERLLALVGGRPRDASRDDLTETLAETLGSPMFSAAERTILKNVLGLHRIRVQDVMVPRADIVAVSAETSLGDLLALFRTAGHSRLPVYNETLDDPRGMIHIRDFLDYLAAKAETRATRRRKADAPPPNLGRVDLSMTLASARILRPVLFVPPSMPAIDLLVRMQATRTHMALVIDEYGGTDGLLSIEDLVEVVVGDIEDEHDVDTAELITGSDDAFVADARAALEDVSEAIGIDLMTGEMAEDVDTLGGLIVTLAGRVPSRGELIAGPEHLEFEVLDADPRRVKRVRIYRRENGKDTGKDNGKAIEGPANPALLPPPASTARPEGGGNAPDPEPPPA